MGADHSAQVCNKSPTKGDANIGQSQIEDYYFNEGVGKEKTDPARGKAIHTTGPQIGENLGTWKRIPRVGLQGEEEIKALVEIRGKRKKSRVLQELDENVVSEKRSKFEGEVVEMGQLMAKHMGSAEAAGQLRRKQ